MRKIILTLFIILSIASAALADKITNKEMRIIHILKTPPEGMSHVETKELAAWLAINLNDHKEMDKILKASWGQK